MTNAIFLDTMFPFLSTQNEDEEAKMFIEAAQRVIKFAKQEQKFGDIAVESAEKEKNQSFLTIAAWHYEEGLAKFRQAISNLQQAKSFSISSKCRKNIETKLNEYNANVENLLKHIQQS